MPHAIGLRSYGLSRTGIAQGQADLQIYRTIKRRKLTQTQAGHILGIEQPHVSSLMRGQSGMFSAERLMEVTYR